MTIVVISILVLALTCCVMSVPFSTPKVAMVPASENYDCLMALTNMSDCLTYVEDKSNLTKPDKGCCSELAGLVDSNPICLCKLLGKSDSIGIKIDSNKALKLPSVCGVSTPPVSTCSSMAPDASYSSSNDAAPSTGNPSSSSVNGVSAIQLSLFTNFIFVCLRVLLILHTFFVSVSLF